MSGEFSVNDPTDPGDWEESPDHPSTLPQNVTPERPADAVEPPHVPIVVPDGDDADDAVPRNGERDAEGRFRRHRAKSQTASADDVDAINTLTRRIKEAEEAEGADVARHPGESDRVYTLRRRAEVLERRRTTAVPAQTMPPSAPSASLAPASPREAARATPPAAAPDPEPNPDDATKYPDGQYDRKFINDFARWAARAEHRTLREKDAKETAEREQGQRWTETVNASRAKHTDYDTVAFADTDIPPGSPTDVFIMEDEAGAEVLYHLQKNPAERRDILGKTALGQIKALSLLSQRLVSPPSRVQAGTTGSAAAPSLSAVPRPPNPVRTGPVSVNTDAPGDDDSLEAHERHYYPGRRR